MNMLVLLVVVAAVAVIVSLASGISAMAHNGELAIEPAPSG